MNRETFSSGLLKVAAQAAVQSAKEPFYVGSLDSFEKRLKPGDVLLMSLTNSTTASGRAYDRASQAIQGDKGHTSLYAGGGKAYDTRFVQGAKLLPLSQIAAGKNVVALRPNVSESRKADAMKRADSMLGAPYGGTVGVFSRMLFSSKLPLQAKTPKDIRDKLVCSRMITRAYGNDNFGLKRHPEMVYPSEFLRAPRLKKVVEYRGKGFVPGQQLHRKTAAVVRATFDTVQTGKPDALTREYQVTFNHPDGRKHTTSKVFHVTPEVLALANKGVDNFMARGTRMPRDLALDVMLKRMSDTHHSASPGWATFGQLPDWVDHDAAMARGEESWSPDPLAEAEAMKKWSAPLNRRAAHKKTAAMDPSAGPALMRNIHIHRATGPSVSADGGPNTRDYGIEYRSARNGPSIFNTTMRVHYSDSDLAIAKKWADQAAKPGTPDYSKEFDGMLTDMYDQGMVRNASYAATPPGMRNAPPGVDRPQGHAYVSPQRIRVRPPGGRWQAS